MPVLHLNFKVQSKRLTFNLTNKGRRILQRQMSGSKKIQKRNKRFKRERDSKTISRGWQMCGSGLFMPSTQNLSFHVQLGNFGI